MRRVFMGVGLAVIALLVLGGAVVAGWVIFMSSVEQPRYTLIRSDGAFEIRDYPALVVAEVERSGGRDAAVRAGFRPLANYIFARGREGDGISMTAPVTQTPGGKIAMTAPVTQERAATANPTEQRDETGSWTVRFIMPSKYKLADLPRPAGADVRLREIAARRVAAVRFSGVATDTLLASKEAELRTWLAAQNLKALGQPTFAYYNDPMTPGILRRNEVIIAVAEAGRS